MRGKVFFKHFAVNSVESVNVIGASGFMLDYLEKEDLKIDRVAKWKEEIKRIERKLNKNIYKIKNI